MTLRNYPILSVTSLSINGLAVQPRPPLAPSTTNGGYVFDDTRIMLDGVYGDPFRAYCGFVKGFQNIAIVYSAGFATTPADLEQACIDMIGDWFKYRDRIGQVSMGIEGQTISFVNVSIPARTQGVLNQYKRVFASP